MRKIMFSGVVVVFAAASAFGQLGSFSPSSQNKLDHNPGLPGSTVGPRAGLVCNFDVTGIESVDAQGNPANFVAILNVATCVGLPNNSPIAMNGVGWNVSLNAPDPSWLNELTVGFSADGDTLPDINLRPGASVAAPGAQAFSSNGIVKFSSVPLPDILLPTGKLRMEFFESFDDFAGPEAEWVSGILQIQVTPEPATMSLLALGGLVALRRRK